MKEWIVLIQNVGFPIAVALYLLFRYDKRLGQLSEVLKHINEKMAILIELHRAKK